MLLRLTYSSKLNWFEARHLAFIRPLRVALSALDEAGVGGLAMLTDQVAVSLSSRLMPSCDAMLASSRVRRRFVHIRVRLPWPMQ